MKKLLLYAILVIGTAAISGVFADSIQQIDADDIFVYEHVTYAKASKDTIGGTDSIIVLKKGWKPSRSKLTRPGAYVLRVPPIGGTGSDSVLYMIIYKGYNSSGTVVYEDKTDTINVATGIDYLMPFGRKVGADNYSVMVKGITGNGGVQIVPPLEVWKAIPIKMFYQE